MRLNFVRTVGLALVAFTLLASRVVRAGEYDVIDIAAQGGSSVVVPAGMNKWGQVVGRYVLPDGTQHAFLWSVGDAFLQDLGTLGGPNSAATEINDAGRIIGTSDVPSGTDDDADGDIDTHDTHAFVWSAGATPPMRDLGTLGGRNSAALAINAIGHVVGRAETAEGFTIAFTWTPGAPSLTPLLPPASANIDLALVTSGEAIAVNDAGMVLGHMGNALQGPSAGFVWTPAGVNGAITDTFETILNPGGDMVRMHAQNDAGKVVGEWLDSSDPYMSQAFIWEGGAIAQLYPAAASTQIFALAQLLPFFALEPRVLNASGAVIGSAQVGSAPLAAFIRSGASAPLRLDEDGGLGGSTSFAASIANGNDTIVGAASAPDNGDADDEEQLRAFRWAGGTMEDVWTNKCGSDSSDADATQSMGIGVNDAGTVMGFYAGAESAGRAFVLSGGDLRDISPQLAAMAIPFKINEAGHIVGSWLSADGTHAGAFVAVPLAAGAAHVGTRAPRIGDATPVASCKNITIGTARDPASITAEEVDDGSIVGCGALSLSTPVSTGPNTYQVTLVATSGDSSDSCVATVTVADVYEIIDLGIDDAQVVAINGAGQVAGHTSGGRLFFWREGEETIFRSVFATPPAGASSSGTTLRPTDVNSAGMVVGYAQETHSGQEGILYDHRRSFLWQATSGAFVADLGTLPGAVSVGDRYPQAAAINDAGVVVGMAPNAAGVMRAFVWRSGDGMLELPSPLETTTAIAVNESGWILGYSQAASIIPRGLVWIPDPLGPSGYRLVDLGVGRFAFSINDAGRIAGLVGVDETSYGPATWTIDPLSFVVTEIMLERHGGLSAALATNEAGKTFGFETIPGFPNGYMRPITWQGSELIRFWNRCFLVSSFVQRGLLNEDGVIAGSYLDGMTSIQSAYVFANGSLMDIMPEGGTQSHAVDMNAAGHVVGGYYRSDFQSRAFIARPPTGATGGTTSTPIQNDPEPIMFSCQAATVVLDALGRGTLDPAAVIGFTCGVASYTVSPTQFTCADLGTRTVTVSVVGFDGAVQTCPATVSVVRPAYDLIDIGVGYIVKVNEAGQALVAESFYDPGTNSSTSSLYLWEAGISTPIVPAVSGENVSGADINAHGEVVGSRISATGATRAFAWSVTLGLRDVGPALAPGDSSMAVAINDLGQIVGRHTSKLQGFQDPTRVFFVWEDGTTVDLGKLPNSLHTAPTGLNNAGQVYGGASGYIDPVTGSYESRNRAFYWKRPASSVDPHAPLLDLGVLGEAPGAESGFTQALAMNALGQIVGNSGQYGAFRTFLWDPNAATPAMIDLDPTGAAKPMLWSAARMLNNSGLVTGTTEDPTAGSSEGGRAFLWDAAGGFRLLPIETGWNGASAAWINDVGAVVGNADAPDGSAGAVLWPAGAGPFLLGAGPYSRASAISDDGVVYGIATSVGGEYVFALRDGAVYDLTPAEGHSSNWSNSIPGFTQSGYVYGYFGRRDGTSGSFLASPLDPAPILDGPASIDLTADPLLCGAVATFAVDASCGTALAQTAGLPSGSTFPIGTTVVEFTATDDKGRTATHGFTVTVTYVDTTAPEIALAGAAEITLECHLGAYSEAGATASDPCSVAPTVAIGGDAVATSLPGTYVVTYDAVDAAGNAAPQAIRTVTVVDTTPPVITLNGPATAAVSCAGPAYVEQGAAASDACDGGVQVVIGGTVDSGLPGTYTLTYDATDAAGNPATRLTRTVTVEAAGARTITFADPTLSVVECHGGATLDLGASVAGGCGGDPTVTISGAVNADAPGTYPIVYAASGVTPITRVITVVDTTPPTLSGVPASLSAPCDAIPAAPQVTATDACAGSLATTLSETLSNGGVTLTRVWAATDASGNSTSATQVITLTDTTGPVITGVGASVTIECPATLDFGAPAASDACGTATITYVDVTTPGTGTLKLTATRTWTATDGSGNASAASRTILVMDRTPPTLALPVDVIVECGGSTLPSATGVATAADACDGAVITAYSDSVDGSTITRTWTAFDASGNSTSGAQTITSAGSGGEATITLIGAPSMTLECHGAPFADPGATVSGGCGGAPSFTIMGAGAVDVNLPGTYMVTYATGDLSITRSVTVVDTTAPVIASVPADLTLIARDCHRCPVSGCGHDDGDDDDDRDNGCGSSRNRCRGGGSCDDDDRCDRGRGCSHGQNRGWSYGSGRGWSPSGHGGNSCSRGGNGGSHGGCAWGAECPGQGAIVAEVPDLRSQVVAADGCGSAFVTQSPAPGATVGLGTHAITFVVTDDAGNATSRTVTLRVLGGLTVEILEPLERNGAHEFTVGRTIPVKARLRDCSGEDVSYALRNSVVVTIDVDVLASLTATQGTELTETYNGVGDPGSRLEWRGSHFQYNLSTNATYPTNTRSGPSYVRLRVSAAYTSAPLIEVGRKDVRLESGPQGGSGCP